MVGFEKHLLTKETYLDVNLHLQVEIFDLVMMFMQRCEKKHCQHFNRFFLSDLLLNLTIKMILLLF